jgi:hypothetical protein
MGLGMGHCCGWEAANRTKGDSQNVVDPLGEVAALVVVAHWECVGAQVVHLLGPLAEQTGQLLVFRLHYLDHENSVPFCWCRIGPKGAWSEPPEARS